jgi:hypothetical protein
MNRQTLLRLHREVYEIAEIEYKQALEFHPNFPLGTARGVSNENIIKDIENQINEFGYYNCGDKSEKNKIKFVKKFNKIKNKI